MYFDYPGPVNRVRWIFERVDARGFGGGTIGIEECTPSKRAQMQLGAPKAKLVDAGDIVEEMRWVKDEDEIGVMRRATYFADYTVQSGRAYIEANGSVTEDQILKATADAVADKMSKELTSVVGVGHRAAVRRAGPVRQALGVSPRDTQQRRAEEGRRAHPQLWGDGRRL